MNIEEIRKNAPKGATHYTISNAGKTLHYCKIVDEKWHHYYDKRESWAEFLFFMLEINPLF